MDGAAKYNLQLSTDPNFLSGVTTQNGILSTRYSPPSTLKNDQYYWRVIPVNASGAATDWAAVPVWQFHKIWSDQPSLEYPADGQHVSDPLFYQWKPASLATRYQVQVSQDPTFQDSTTATCPSTVHTTYTPNGSGDACWPAQGKVTYWRVLAFDDPTGVPSEFLNAEVRSFIYLPDQVNLVSPNAGQQVQIPTLSWEPFAGAGQYRVSITPDGTTSTKSYTTNSTSFTPTTTLAPGTYRWQVQAITGNGQAGLSLALADQRTFEVIAQDPATASTPEPTGSSGPSQTNPTLTWEAVSGASSYKIRYRAAGDLSWSAPATSYSYPAGEITGVLTPGNYEWQVVAYDGSTQLGTSVNIGTFTVIAIDTIGGYKAAITATDLADGSTACAAGLPQQCADLRQTPVLGWSAAPNAAYYKLWISRDDQFTNVVSGFPIRVNNTVWMDPAALPDSTAGTPYYWFVQPCNSATCAPQSQAMHAFEKLSNPVQLVSPAQGSPQQDAVTLKWQDYLATEAAADTASSSLSTPARIEARNYRVQTATDPLFTNVIETQIVDQTEFTSFATTYAEGPIYWRVQAIDGTGNSLPWSNTGALCPGAAADTPSDTPCSFQKHSLAPTLLAPLQDDVVSGSAPFDWQPQPFAATYNVEVYTGDGNPPSSGNRVFGITSLKQVSYTPSTPLPPGSYRWRIRRIDGAGHPGGWSDLTGFTVTGQPPTLLNPAEGAHIAPRCAVFNWQPPNDDSTVAKYRFTAVSSAGTKITADTAATAYAPLVALAGGAWTWSVATLDTGGKVIATSPAQDVVVDASPSASVTITGTGKVGTDLSVEPVNWDLSGVTTTYQWFVGTTKVSGATSELYRVQAKDLGKDIYVQVTGTKPGYNAGTAKSNVIRAITGDAVVVISNPTITGTRSVGYTLTASPGTWATDTTPTYSYQWLRGGSAISGATRSTYTLVTADAAKQISVRVTARVTGLSDGVATSAPVTIRKIATHTKLALAKSKIRRAYYPHATITVTDPYSVKPTGTVRVYSGSKLVKQATLRAWQNGTISVKLPKQSVGRHAIWARYLGNAKLAASHSTKVTLTVVR